MRYGWNCKGALGFKHQPHWFDCIVWQQSHNATLTFSWPISQIPQCNRQISHNAPVSVSKVCTHVHISVTKCVLRDIGLVHNRFCLTVLLQSFNKPYPANSGLVMCSHLRIFIRQSFILKWVLLITCIGIPIVQFNIKALIKFDYNEEQCCLRQRPNAIPDILASMTISINVRIPSCCHLVGINVRHGK